MHIPRCALSVVSWLMYHRCTHRDTSLVTLGNKVSYVVAYLDTRVLPDTHVGMCISRVVLPYNVDITDIGDVTTLPEHTLLVQP